MTNHVIAKPTGRQLRAARALLGWTARDLAGAAKVGLATVFRAEASEGAVRVTKANAAALVRALEDGGADLMLGEGCGVGVRVREGTGGAGR
jgi:transcriptional regulator with XRE-family HTH domain